MDKQSWKPRVGMKPLSERDENKIMCLGPSYYFLPVGMKPLSERDENLLFFLIFPDIFWKVRMKPLSERVQKHMLNRNSDNGRVEWEG
ncbi:MAG: hypothetical protein WBH60_01215 [Fervidobacterium sp.]